MKTLVVMNEKGGVGKTTIAVHAGWYFAERLPTLVIDLDQQANLSATLAAHLAAVDSVALFAEPTRVPATGRLTVAGSTRALLGVESVDRGCIETFRDSLAAMAGDYAVCVIDTPPALSNRSFGALLAADAVLAPIGINDYSIQGVAELLRAIKGVARHYRRPEPCFLGLLPSLFDRKSRRERLLFESLAAEAGKLLFPGILAKRDLYARAVSEGRPVWALAGSAAREAGREIRGVFDHIAARMELAA
ncbi:ParA family protein [Azospirillum picis]|uniref:Chromosome partitioning protein n=1 Tax=Azospirillum picis TaxID=488438 RepID=A0ABU0MVD5_9PROT|nr:ParA family protein [Azospirillum picis]MBP2300927.1 chromosome partitioning protein [Azospirillum picis]MDQ0537031.1 chromosome partitioning protein [Azospirillum picis]